MFSFSAFILVFLAQCDLKLSRTMTMAFSGFLFLISSKNSHTDFRVFFEIYNALSIYRIETESVDSHFRGFLLHRWFIEGSKPLSVCIDLR